MSLFPDPPFIHAHCDGGSRGNPGPSGYGAHITDAQGRTIAELSDYLGIRTNNFAEYSGLLAVLDWALANGHSAVKLVSDSELMVKQIQGKYKVNSPDLKPLWQQARDRIAKLDRFEISHALRHKNKQADALANQAMDRGTGKPAAGRPAATSTGTPVQSLSAPLPNPPPSQPKPPPCSAASPRTAPSTSSAEPPSPTASSLKSSRNDKAAHSRAASRMPGSLIAKAGVWLAAALLAAPAPAQTRLQTTPQTITVTTTEPLPLDAPDRSVTSLPTAGPATQPLFNAPTDYLRLDPSITLQERSPNGVQADISIRGTTFEQTLVLVDGLRLNDPETGHLNLDLPFPLEAVARIDILHGSGSTLFGSDAIGGAINLVTAAPTDVSATLRLGGGNLGSTEQHLQLSLLRPHIATRLTASRDTSDGFSDPAQGANENDRGYRANLLALDIFATLSPKLPPTEILLGASDRPYGANLFYGPYDSSERTKGFFAAIRQPLSPNTLADFAFRRHTDLFILEVSNPNLYRNNHVDGLWQADLRRLDTLRPNLTLAYGLEADGDTIRSTNLGRHARNQGAGYLALTASFRRLTFQLGARQELYRGPTPVFSPSASAGYSLAHSLRAHAAAGTGFRLPTYVDLYYADPTTIGNPSLKPETSQSYEAGLEWTPTRPNLRLTATGFTLRQSNAIDYSKSIPTQPYQATNIGHLAYTGLETSATCTPTANQQLTLAYTYLHAPPAPTNLISEYAYNYASSNASFAWQARFAHQQLALRTQVSVVQQTQRAAYPLWTVALTRTQGFVRPYIRTENLANTQYQELPGVPQPGRTILAGVTVTLPGH